MEETTANLLRVAEIFGLLCYGNVVTLMKCLRNMLFSDELFYYWFLLNIYIFSLHLLILFSNQVDMNKALGNRKGEGFLLSSKTDYANHNENPSKDCFDLVAFDGAADSQKVGKIIEAKFSRVEVMKGVEHLGSLFVSKCFNEPCPQLLKAFTKILS